MKAITSQFQDMGCRDKEEEIIFFAHVLLADLEQSCVMPYGDHYGADDIAYGNGYKYFCGRFSEMPSSNKEEVAKGLFRFVAGIEDKDVLLALGFERVSVVQTDDLARGVQDIRTGHVKEFFGLRKKSMQEAMGSDRCFKLKRRTLSALSGWKMVHLLIISFVGLNLLRIRGVV